MARKTIKPQTQLLYAGPSPANTGHYLSGVNIHNTTGLNFTSRIRELFRVQSVNSDTTNGNLTPVGQFGNAGPIDYVSTEPPTVSLSFNYLLANMINEKALGFYISSGTTMSGCLTQILTKEQDERNYFLITRTEGNNANDNAAAFANGEFVYGFGNGFIANYTSEASVGNLPTVTIDVEALNVKIDPASSTPNVDIPAIDVENDTPVVGKTYQIPTGTTHLNGLQLNQTLATISVLRPGDILVDFDYSDLGTNISNTKPQSYSLQIPISRESINELGSDFAKSRDITLPLTATLSLTYLAADIRSGNLYDLFNDCDGQTYNTTIHLRSPCKQYDVAGYILRNGRLTNQSQSMSLGSNQTTTFNLQFPIGGPQETVSNVFFSGIAY